MLRRSVGFALTLEVMLVLGAACGAASPPTVGVASGPSPVPAPIDAGAFEDAEGPARTETTAGGAVDAAMGGTAGAAVDAGTGADVVTGATAMTTADAGADVAPTLVLPAPPPVSGRATRLAPGESRSVGRGVTVRWAVNHHKHAVGGSATAIVELAVKRGGRSKTVVVSGDDGIEAEIDGFGVIVSVSGASDELEVRTLGAARRPLDEDAAAALVEREAARHALPTGSASYSSEGGILQYTTMRDGVALWEARVGLLSRRVWFVYPAR